MAVVALSVTSGILPVHLSILVWTSIVAQRSPAYRVYSRPTTAASPRKRFRWLRRLFWLSLFAGLCLLGVWVYFYNVYAPGLEIEARTVPSLVHEQLSLHHAAYVPLQQMSSDLPSAIVSIEDRRFYHHPGIDPQGMARAVWVNLRNEHVDQGGSTLEEQLVKRVIVHATSSLRDKLRIAGLAWAIDQEFSKQQVLELYLNEAYFGQGAYGAGAAARIYFGIDVGSLTLPQAALLAALPQAPSVYGSHLNSSTVVDRQHIVLQDMREQGFITVAQEKAADETALRFALPNP
jgi:penicillin-binding protein 1A